MKRLGLRRLGYLATGALVIATGGSILVARTGVAPPPPVVDNANLWVNLTAGGTPTRCSTACAYDSTKAYGSFNAAVAAASCGDDIAVRAGTYGGNLGEVINNVAGHAACGTDITIRPTTGAAVTMGDGTNHTGTCQVNTSNIDICDTHLIVKGMTAASTIKVHAVASNTTLDTMDLSLGCVFLSGSNATVKNSTIGKPGTLTAFSATLNGCDGIQITTEGGCVVNGTTCLQPTGVTIQGNLFRNILRRDPSICGGCDDHVDAIQGLAGATVTIERNKFYNDENMAIVGCEFGNGGCSGWTIQNNMVGATVANVLTLQSSNTSNVTVRFNSFISSGLNLGAPNTTFTSNLFQSISSGQCTSITAASVTFTYNVMLFGSTQCGATNTVLGNGVTFGYADLANADLHVPGGAGFPGNGLGNPTSPPATDYDNGARGNPPDAGADES